MVQCVRFCLVAILLCGVTSAFASPLLRDVSAELVESAKGTSVVEGVDGWLFLKEELQHVAAGKFWGEAAAGVTRTKKKQFADPVAAIVDYNNKLSAQGISLYLVPVPPKALIYQEKVQQGLSSDSADSDRALYREFYTVLEQKGVRVIDLIPTLLAKKDTVQLYCKTDTHFSGAGLTYFAKDIAQQIAKEPWYADVPKQTLTKTDQVVSMRGDLLQMSGAQTNPEQLTLSIVRSQETGALLDSDPASPVILLGDSHGLVFTAGGDLYAKGGGLFDHLSAELGFVVDLLGVRGSGVTPARIKLYQRSKRDKTYLDGKKTVVWCFTARDFTGKSGWRNIPVVP